jgi:hypothetical protein
MTAFFVLMGVIGIFTALPPADHWTEHIFNALEVLVVMPLIGVLFWLAIEFAYFLKYWSQLFLLSTISKIRKNPQWLLVPLVGVLIWYCAPEACGELVGRFEKSRQEAREGE